MLVAAATVLAAVGGHVAVVSRWRGQVDAALEQAKADREILHERIGDKEAALAAQLKELTEVVSDLRIEVARLTERMGHVERPGSARVSQSP